MAGNQRGMFIYDAEYNVLRNNLVVENDVGVHLWAGSINNKVENNDFINNRQQIRYVSTRDMWGAARGVTAASLVAFLVFSFFDVHVANVPRVVWVLDWLLCLAFVAASRMLARTIIERPQTRSIVARGKEVIVVGAGDAGQLVIKEMQRSRQLGYTPIGIVDDVTSVGPHEWREADDRRLDSEAVLLAVAHEQARQAPRRPGGGRGHVRPLRLPACRWQWRARPQPGRVRRRPPTLQE